MPPPPLLFSLLVAHLGQGAGSMGFCLGLCMHPLIVLVCVCQSMLIVLILKRKLRAPFPSPKHFSFFVLYLTRTLFLCVRLFLPCSSFLQELTAFFR